jgi:hypothetical protein
MLKITCDECKQEVVINPHYYDAKITMTDEPIYQTRSFTAVVRSESICPKCGCHLYKYHECPISTSNIIDLALRREIHA